MRSMTRARRWAGPAGIALALALPTAAHAAPATAVVAASNPTSTSTRPGPVQQTDPTHLAVGAAAHGAFCTSGEIKAISFEAQPGQAYRVELSDVGPDLAARTVRFRVNTEGSGFFNPGRQPLTTDLPPQRAGTVVVEMTIADQFDLFGNPVSGPGGPGDSYRVRVSAVGDPVPTVTALAVTPNQVRSGQSTKATATLLRPAPAGGATIDVQARGDYGYVTIPSHVTVPPGATSTTIPVQTRTYPADITVTLLATAGPGSATTDLLLLHSR